MLGHSQRFGQAPRKSGSTGHGARRSSSELGHRIRARARNAERSVSRMLDRVFKPRSANSRAGQLQEASRDAHAVQGGEQAPAQAEQARLTGRYRIEQLLQRARLQGFQQIPIEASRFCPLRVMFLPPTRECHKHGRTGPFLALEALRDLVAVEFRHHNIEENELRLKLTRNFKSLGALTSANRMTAEARAAMRPTPGVKTPS
jgi:hypothetical protein